MHVITIATSSYALHARRLVRTLGQCHPGLGVVVYAEDSSLATAFRGLDARVEVLPEITSMGVKRAKFSAYAHAAAEGGGFVYLDADILVLRDLGELLAPGVFTACRDDLRECPFIADPLRPWVGAPELSGAGYFNSGVFAVPDGFADFFDRIAIEAADDREWLQYTIPSKLYDNHFLCAKVVQSGIAVRFLSEFEYNWQGFRSGDKLNCYVDSEGALRSRHAGEALRLVHFAGVGDIDTYLGTLPVDVARVLARSLGEEEVGCLEVINAALGLGGRRSSREALIVAQALGAPPPSSATVIGAERPLLSNVAALASVAHSCEPSECLWNGMPCGGAYLSAAEYDYLRRFVRQASVRSVLEFGAGYTSTLFARLVDRQIAVESQEGPWLEHARSRGCDARLVAFSESDGFDDAALRGCLRAAFGAGGPTMVFLDSPTGTVRRALVARQLVRLAPDVDYVVVHDSVRDSTIVYMLCTELGLRVLAHVPTHRGLTVLGREDVRDSVAVSGGLLRDRAARMRFRVVPLRFDVLSGADVAGNLTLELIGEGHESISAASDDLRFSMHVLSDKDDVLIWDTARYSLPVDLEPSDVLTFRVAVPRVQDLCAPILAFDFVKEGDFWWSSVAGLSMPSVRWSELPLLADRGNLRIATEGGSSREVRSFGKD